ncbi:MAG: hypothetical protein ACI89X_000315 [Planctomycetota bacterium]|jgi:hypothetical protein
MKHYITVVWLCLAVGCAQQKAVAPQGASGHAQVLDRAPTPYSASEIRDAHPNGTTLSFLVQVAGSDDVVQVMQFSDGDATGTTVVSSVQNPDGEVLGKTTSARATWDQLRDHASFEATKTSIRKSQCKVVAGSYDCMRYEVTRGDGAVQELHFAKTKPGPPVLLLMRKGEKEMLRMELIEYHRGS